MRRFLPLILSILVACNGNHVVRKDITEILYNQGWIGIDSIDYGSKNWNMANHSGKEWEINVKNDSLIISDFLERSNVVYNLTNGYLEGTNNGEWGGKLSFYPQDVSAKNTDILDGNICSIFKYNGSIYVLEGLAHLNFSEGKLLKLTESNDIWKCQTILELRDKPCAYTISKENNELYIVSFKKLFKIKNERVIEIIVDNAFWESLYPNSVVIINDNVIIGMRGLIATVNLKNRKVTAYEKK